MSGYVNITRSVCAPINDQVIEFRGGNCLKREGLARIGYFALALLSGLTRTVDTVIGIGAGVGTIFTGGMHRPTYHFAQRHLVSSRMIIVSPYTHLVRTINPSADFSSKKESISLEGNGFITNYVYETFEPLGIRLSGDDNVLLAQVASRITYLVMAVALVVSRVADAAIGIFAAVLGIVTLGKIASINSLAFRALQFPGIIQDIFFCAVRIINPHSKAYDPQVVRKQQ